MIELTEQQRDAVRNGKAVRMSIADVDEDVVILRAAIYENILELLDDQREQKAVLQYSMKQAAKAAQENPY